MSREMKNSENKAFGQIPSEWKISRLKYIVAIKKDIAGKEGYTVLSITQQGIKPKNLDSNEGQLAENYSNYQLVDPGDFAMNHMDLLTGWVDISKYSGVTSPDYRVFKLIDNDGNFKKYYLYIMQTCYSNRIFYRLGAGVSGFERWRLQAPAFLNFKVPVPPLSEQQSIAAFLDDKCGKIDEAIERHKKIIEKLDEYWSINVQEKVTSGLNENTSTKDSGDEIIGRIPSSWISMRLKYLCSITTGDGDTQDSTSTGEYPFYVRSPIIERSTRYTFNGEGILMAGDGVGAGRVFHHAYGKYAVHQRVYRLYDFSNKINTDYLFYYLNSMFPHRMDQGSAQSTVPSVRLPMLKDFIILVPTKDEQKEIALYLKSAELKYRDSVKKHKEIIDKLGEYKKSLIYAAVTGKIDCRKEE